jgi:hypothetical protein
MNKDTIIGGYDPYEFPRRPPMVDKVTDSEIRDIIIITKQAEGSMAKREILALEELLAIRRQAQEAPKAESVPYDGDPATRECDYHKACRGKKAASQSAEEAKDKIAELAMAYNAESERRFMVEQEAIELAKRYSAVVEALEEILPVEGPGEGLAPYYIHSDTIKRARNALSDLDEARKE